MDFSWVFVFSFYSNGVGDMKHKDYMKLMKTPFDDLSKEDQQKRTTEFNRRMKAATKFMSGLRDGKIDEEFVDLVEDDEPMKETIETLKIKVNDNLGAEA